MALGWKFAGLVGAKFRALFVNVGMILLGVLGVVKCIGIHERTESGRVHGNPAKGEEDGGSAGVGVPCVVKSKEACHSGKGTLRAKALNKNSWGGKGFEKECQGIGGERVWREAPSSNSRTRVANIFEVCCGYSVWEGGEVGLTVREEARPQSMQVGKQPREMSRMRDVGMSAFPDPAMPVNRGSLVHAGCSDMPFPYCATQKLHRSGGGRNSPLWESF